MGYEKQQSMYLGFWRLNARKPAPLLGDGQNCASEVSKSGMGDLAFAACRTRSSPCDMRTRHSVRYMLGSTAFPSVPCLRSTVSAPGRPGLFDGFSATIRGSDFCSPFIIGYGSSPSRCGPCLLLPGPGRRSPGSRAKSVHACQGLGPRGTKQTLAIARLSVLPSARTRASAPRNSILSRLNGWPTRTPANAS